MNERMTRVCELWQDNPACTLGEVADQVGLTRERVRQIVRLAGLPSHLAYRRILRTRIRDEADEARQRSYPERACAVCQQPHRRRPGLRTCSHECALAWQHQPFRRILDSKIYAQHRRSPSVNADLSKPPNRRYVYSPVVMGLLGRYRPELLEILKPEARGTADRAAVLAALTGEWQTSQQIADQTGLSLHRVAKFLALADQALVDRRRVYRSEVCRYFGEWRTTPA